MARYVIKIPYLDEMGSVYIPAVGNNGAVVRLNERATLLWREIASSGECDDSSSAQRFLTWMLSVGVIERV